MALVLLTLAWGSVAEARGKPAQLPDAYIGQFHYTPAGSGSKGEGIAVAVTSPLYTEGSLAAFGLEAQPSQEDNEFGLSLERALIDYLTAWHFTVSGPFTSANELTFPQKKQSDLLLQVVLDIRPSQPSDVVATRVVTNGFTGKQKMLWSADTKVSFRGAIQFTLWEPMTMQRMWSKTVDIASAGEAATGPAAQIGPSEHKVSVSDVPVTY